MTRQEAARERDRWRAARGLAPDARVADRQKTDRRDRIGGSRDPARAQRRADRRAIHHGSRPLGRAAAAR